MVIFEVLLAIVYVLLIIVIALLVIVLAIPAGILYGLYYLLIKRWRR